jgi:TetR/AcrR family transcriptional regulator, fatty acid metabolism regulator protein
VTDESDSGGTRQAMQHEAAACERAEKTEGGLGVRSPRPHRLHPTAQKILAAAKHILTERGYAAMTLQAISAEAHVNKAGVWYYFGGKQQLVEALLEDIVINESQVFGSVPPADATLEERVDLIVGSATRVGERVRRFAAFYELLPQASRDEELRRHLMTIYDAWYAWAAEVLSPSVDDGKGSDEQHVAQLGQFASVLLDGVFLQTIIGAPSFDLTAALQNARRALTLLAADGSDSTPPPR